MRDTTRLLPAMLGLAFAIAAAPAVNADPPGPFDGTWDVQIVCARAPDGAEGYRWTFYAEVRDGAMLGNYHSPGTDASGTLSGRIRPDGSAFLRMDGNTGRREYSVARVQPGTPFHYTVTARFAGSSGSGRRNELRRCDLTFAKP